MIEPKNIQERFIVEIYDEDLDFWNAWAKPSLEQYEFFSREAAIRNLKECLDESRSDAYRFDYIRNKKYRLRKMYKFKPVYEDTTEEIIP